MHSVKPTTRFRRDLKRLQKRGYDISPLKEVVKMLAEGKALPAKYRDHPLSGSYAGCRECHVTPDWLLVYKIGQGLILYLMRTGTHSDLF